MVCPRAAQIRRHRYNPSPLPSYRRARSLPCSLFQKCGAGSSAAMPIPVSWMHSVSGSSRKTVIVPPGIVYLSALVSTSPPQIEAIFHRQHLCVQRLIAKTDPAADELPGETLPPPAAQWCPTPARGTHSPSTPNQPEIAQHHLNVLFNAQQVLRRPHGTARCPPPEASGAWRQSAS